MTSRIEWTDETWNPVTGCTKISAGCANCYAERMARRLAGRYGYPEAPHHFDVTLHEDKLELPLKWKKPRKIFVCSMSDPYHPDVPASYIVNIYEVMSAAKQHIFIVLTKRPERIIPVLYGEEGKWYLGGGDYLPNIWHLVTTETQEMADKRIPELLKLEQHGWPVLGVSAEPLLEPLYIRRYLYQAYELCDCGNELPIDGRVPLDWVICGGESGPNARLMKIEYARSLRDQCAAVGIPFFFKQHGMYLHTSQLIRGVHFGEHEPRPAGNDYVKCTSKYAAGDLLDGKIHHEYPVAGPPA